MEAQRQLLAESNQGIHGSCIFSPTEQSQNQQNSNILLEFPAVSGPKIFILYACGHSCLRPSETLSWVHSKKSKEEKGVLVSCHVDSALND